MDRLKGKRVLVVGASSGIGRAIAVAAVGEGARVAAAARREASLAALVEETGTPSGPDGAGAVALPLDVRDEAACLAGVDRAAELLGGLDAVVYAVGVAFLHHVSEVDAKTWQDVFASNVTGAALVARAAVPHLEPARGRAVFLSSISADDFPPRRALGPYMVTKAALNKLVEVLQAEHKAVAFTRVSVGDTAPTDFAGTWDGEAIGKVVAEWVSQGVMFGRAMRPEAVARHVIDVLASEEPVAVTRIVPSYHVEDAKA